MIGVVMAGGKGTRMKSSEEKLLLKYHQPVVLHVVDALKNSDCFSKVVAATSPNSPKTQQILEQQKGIEIIHTPGRGYANDLNLILRSIDDHVLVASGDLPYLDGKTIQKIVAQYNPHNVWTSLLVTKGFLDSLGLKSELSVTCQGHQCFLSGISLVNAKKVDTLDSVKENYLILDDKRLAFNLNTRQDYELLGVS